MSDMRAKWVLTRRFGDDEAKQRELAALARTRDRLLEAVAPLEGETVLDVGCGDGVIGFGALSCGAGHVIFSDVSTDLLGECRRIAGGLGVLDQATFLVASVR